MTLIWTVLEKITSHKKMRLAELTTVSKFEFLKPPCVEVTTDSVIRLFLHFFEFHIG